MDAKPVNTLSLRCGSPAIAVEGDVMANLTVVKHDRPLRTPMMHAKRDGQVCFVYAATAGFGAAPLRDHGEPGDVFVFNGRPDAKGLEGRAQVLFVYGPDNLFVCPFDEGFLPREYRWIGRIDDVGSLERLGEHIWRHGACQIEFEVVGV